MAMQQRVNDFFKNMGKFPAWQVQVMHLFMVVITRTNMWLLQVTRGRLGNSFLGKPVLLLSSIGHKSGQRRNTPLFYLHDGNNIVLCASAAGTNSNPAWFRNVQANPDVSVWIKGQQLKMTAHHASGEEKDHLWPRFTTMFSQWDVIQERSHRNFPIVVLEPQH